MGKIMNGNDILRIGSKQGKVIRVALDAAKSYREQHKASMADALNVLTGVLNSPESYRDDPILGPVAQALLNDGQGKAPYNLAKAAPFQIWGAAGIEPNAIEQMRRAANLPVRSEEH